MERHTRAPDLYTALAAEIDKWSLWERVPYLRFLIDNKTATEIAKELGKPPLTIAICLFYAKADLLLAGVKYFILNRKLEKLRIRSGLIPVLNRRAENSISEEKKEEILKNILRSVNNPDKQMV